MTMSAKSAAIIASLSMCVTLPCIGDSNAQTLFKSPGNSCPSGLRSPTFSEVSNNKAAICSILLEWDIARIGGGGSLSGFGYQCGLFATDTRALGDSICTNLAEEYTILTLDLFLSNTGSCPSNSRLATTEEISASQDIICSGLGKNYAAALANNSSLDIKYNCTVTSSNQAQFTNAICATTANVAAKKN